jgi:glutamine synthetase
MKLVEYIWLDAQNNCRSKIRVLDDLKSNEIPYWNYDGSSTGQAITESSEIIIKPRATFFNPLLKSVDFNQQNLLCVCDTYDISGNPLANNHRYNAEKIFDLKREEEPWFGLEQEYFMYKKDSHVPLDYTPDIIQGEFYCSPIVHDKLGVEIAEEHLIMCCKAGIKISGINAEVAPGQWEFQVGPCVGISAGDHMIAARYILDRIAARRDIKISLHPKPLENINGSGCHINYSTKSMREENGLDNINKAVEKLRLKHKEHMEIYGTFNELRMTGLHETSSYDNFSCGYGSRKASIRIGYDTIHNNCGYFEDRRPASNIDPYITTGMIFKTTCTI